ncbi:MAG: TIGR00366 family protein [Polyangiaceae bacterium]
MLSRLGARLTHLSQRYVPAPFTLALTLTLISLVGGLLYAGGQAPVVLTSWLEGSGGGKGFWNLLSFGMQMCLILVTGHALASSPPCRRLLDALAERAMGPRASIAVVAVTAMSLGLVNWGLGLVGGALLARRVGELARERDISIHYPLVAAAGYCGMLIWHAGLSGSAPLKVTRQADLAEVLGAELAAEVGALPLQATVLSPANLAVVATLVVMVPWMLTRMLPGAGERVGPPSSVAEEAGDDDDVRTPARRLDGSRALAWLIAAAGLTTWASTVWKIGLGKLDPNLLNFVFLFVGLALHGSPRAYGLAVGEAAKGCGGIILQFPFYAGIMGILAGTGLLAAAATALASVGSAALPAMGFYSAGFVNLFVPSGGGQWAVQGPALMRAALDTGASPSQMLMALAYGDQWTNMLQPFWALPLLAIARVEARAIVGYTAAVMLVSQLVFIAGLYLGW